MDEAHKFREQFIEAMKHKKFKDDPKCQSFGREVEELFASNGKEAEEGDK